MEQFTANKKPLFDSDIDPKRIKSVADGLRRQGGFESARMLDGYADLLEAQEKAMPVKLEYYDAGLLNNFGGGNIDWWWDYIRNELGRAHSFYQSQVDGIMSAPSGAERLAEALRAFDGSFLKELADLVSFPEDDRGCINRSFVMERVVGLRRCWDKLSAARARSCADAQIQPNIPDLTDEEWEILFRLYPELKARLQKVFDAHDAQAQPQNGDWVLVPRDPTHAMRESAASYGGRGGYNKQRGDDAMEVWRDMLAAVPQPPAASVTDAMVEDGCMAWNKSAGLGYAVADRDCMRAAIEAALAAQENLNG